MTLSEAEKKRRQDYKRKRKGRIFLQVCLLVLVLAIAVGTALTYYRLSKTSYISYRESGSADYRVQLKENDFYEQEWQESGKAYVASLVQGIAADFSYRLAMDARDVAYAYTYRVDAQLEIANKHTGAPIYQSVRTLAEEQSHLQSSSEDLVIEQSVLVDYGYYNGEAERFIKTYQLPDTSSTLILQMHVSVEGNCNSFEQSTHNDYVQTIRVPLTKETVEINVTSTVPDDDSRVLACSSATNPAGYLWASVTCFSLAILLAIVLVVYVIKTRNHDINYALRVRRIVSAYRSFIQQINNDFDLSLYQAVAVNSFPEMLGIRDTIGAPVLMYENEDKTCTHFYIPTATDLLYVFEVKVEDYDEIYGTGVTESELAAEQEALAAMQTPVEEPVEEVTEEAVEESAEEAAARRFDFGPKRNHSFEAKLAMAPDEVKEFYAQVKAFAKGRGVKVVRSHKQDRIYKGRTLFAVLTFKGQKLAIALAMDPKTADAKYHAKDMSEVKRYEKTPMLMRITSQRKVKYAIELLTALFEAAGIQ